MNRHELPTVEIGDQIEHRLLPGLRMTVRGTAPCEAGASDSPHSEYEAIDAEGSVHTVCAFDVVRTRSRELYRERFRGVERERRDAAARDLYQAAWRGRPVTAWTDLNADDRQAWRQRAERQLRREGAGGQLLGQRPGARVTSVPDSTRRAR